MLENVFWVTASNFSKTEFLLFLADRSIHHHIEIKIGDLSLLRLFEMLAVMTDDQLTF